MSSGTLEPDGLEIPEEVIRRMLKTVPRRTDGRVKREDGELGKVIWDKRARESVNIIS